MKRIFNLMLTFVLSVMFLVPSVGAVKNYKNDNTAGEITIKEAIENKTYYVYQMLILDSYDEEIDGYVYKITSDSWKDFIESNENLSIDAGNYVTWVGPKDETTKAEFAKDALEYAKTINSDKKENGDKNDENDVPVISKTAGSTGEVTFDGLKLGYYLVDSSAGALCLLTTAIPEIEITEKNSVPTITKEVLENDTITEDYEGDYGDTNSAFIGEVVKYRTTITVGKGAQNYKLYDKMTDGLTLGDTITVKLNNKVLNEKDGDVVNYIIKKNETVNNETYTFTIEFKKELAANDVILVEYTALVNANAVTANENTTRLEYGDNHFTDYDTTTTYTYSFDLIKTDNNNKVITGAKFRLYDGNGSNANEIHLVKVSEGVYRVAIAGVDNTEDYVEIEAGIALIKGLDGDQTYYLEETQNPDGYTKLLGRTKVIIVNANLTGARYTYACAEGTLNGTECIIDEENTVDATKYYADEDDNAGVQIVNTRGNLLPGTGGIGTTLFVIIGSLMVTLFGLLLVTKFRMSKMDN